MPLIQKAWRWVAAALVSPILVAASSQASGQTTQPAPILAAAQFTLDNGLTVFVREEHRLPIVSVAVVYNAGSRFDPPGKAGLAHLIEHLLFYGSQHNPRNFLMTMQGLGISNTNGGTGPDLTNLIETAPVSQLDAVLWLESDRMGYLLPAVTQQILDEQIAIVRNEINVGRDQPGGEVNRQIMRGVFAPGHPYHEVTVGDPAQLGTITLDDVRNFVQRYYSPGNAAIIIAGDITPSEALEKVRRYFGGLPTSPRPGRTTSWLPELGQDRRERLFDTASPQLFLTWPTPSYGTIEDVHLRLAGSILMEGASSRVRRRLSAAGIDSSDLSWSFDARSMASLFRVSITAPSAAEFRTIERIIRQEISNLASGRPTDEEMERARRSRRLELRRLTQRTTDFSDLLGAIWALSDGNVGSLDANMQQMDAATPADVSAAARRWLDRSAFVLDLEPRVQVQSASQDVDRSRIPDAAAFRAATFPETHLSTLPNGLKVRHARWPGGSFVAASLIVRGGAGVDPRDKPGLARLTSALLTSGAGRLSEQQLATELARLDASLQATTDLDSITLTLVAPRERLANALALLETMVTAPTFPDAAVARERTRQLRELQDVSNAPRLLSRATVRRLLYGTGSAYAAQGDGLGTASGVNSITRADLAEYHHSWFNPANSEIVIVGDIDQTEAAAALAGSLGRWSGSGPQAPVASVPARIASPGVYLIDRPGMEQADLTAATLLDAPVSPTNPVNAVLTNIIGDSSVGRIFVNLRDRRQWAYWAVGSIESARAGQMLLIRTQVQRERAAEAIAAIRQDLEGVKGGTPISPAELRRAQDALTLSLPLEWEADEGIANALATQVRQGLPEGAIGNYVTAVRAVTGEQVAQAARQTLLPNAMVWVIIGDRSTIEPQLRNAGIAFEIMSAEQ